MKDWNLALNTWIRNSAKWAAQRGNVTPIRSNTPPAAHYMRPDQMDAAPPPPDASPEEYREWYRQQAARNAQ